MDNAGQSGERREETVERREDAVLLGRKEGLSYP
jgi:hypothetical protein